MKTLPIFTARSILLTLVFYLPGAPTLAGDNGAQLARIALAAKQQNVAPAMPWIGGMRISDKNARNIRLADDTNLMVRPEVVHSYNKEVAHDVSHFYEPDDMRVNLRMHYAGRQAGEIISFGFDSGYSAAKIKVKPALFFGYTRAYKIAKQTQLAVGVGGWFGGKVSEQACRDSLDREYYCPTLRAWSDYQQPGHQLHQYYHLVWTHAF